MTSSVLSTSLVAAPIGITLYLLARNRGEKKNYPPARPGLPIVGNLLDIPPRKAWQAFAEWSRELGPSHSFIKFGQLKSDFSLIGSGIITVDMLGDKVIVINDAEVAEELLEKRSAIYSAR
jgi:hypothetical protein